TRSARRGSGPAHPEFPERHRLGRRREPRPCGARSASASRPDGGYAVKLLATWVVGLAAAGLMVAGLLRMGRAAAERAWANGGDRFLSEEERAQDAERERLRLCLLKRLDQKWELAQALSRGELGLLKAAGRFRDLTLPDARAMRWMREHYAGLSE